MIYQVGSGQFKKGGQLFAPASHFFLPDDNTVLTERVPDDYLETLYSANESRVTR